MTHARDGEDGRVAALQAELETLRAQMQEFTATVSHDLRAPLRHITSYAQLVTEDAGPQLSAEVQGFLATITDSARHMGQMLDGLAALSRLGTVPLQWERVDLSELVRDVQNELTRLHPQRHIEWHIVPDVPQVMADAALLRQALGHVMGNAVKFTAVREVARISVRSKPGEKPGRVTLEVQDNGVGYNPAMQSKLFTVFGKLHNAAQFAGLGMGLALTHKIVQRLGAAVSMQTTDTAGCIVKIEFTHASDK